MICIVKRKQLFLTGAAAFMLGILTLLCIKGAAPREVFSALSEQERPTIILDAGHGGEDGGAVSADGVAESHINLAIVRKMDLLLTFLGYDTLLTRSGEEAVYSPDAQTLREKKVSDLKNRVELINAQDNAVLLSIHQNSMPSHPKVHGAQVFYNALSPSDQMAQSVQSVLNTAINPNNDKAAKAMDGTIYLMKNITKPGILVECGFLSNAAEAQRLQTDEYQLKLTLAIVSGYLQYQMNEGQ